MAKVDVEVVGGRRDRWRALLLLAAGLVLVLAPTQTWYVATSMDIEVGVTGYGAAFSNNVHDAAGRRTLADDLGWMLGPIPDGAVVGVLGVLVIALGAWRLRRTSRTVPWLGSNRLTAGIGLLGLLGLVWVLGSSVRATSAFSEFWHGGDAYGPASSVGVSLKEVDLERGAGWVLAGMASAVVLGEGFRPLLRPGPAAPARSSGDEGLSAGSAAPVRSPDLRRWGRR